jgi:hypothetical protein
VNEDMQVIQLVDEVQEEHSALHGSQEDFPSIIFL